MSSPRQLATALIGATLLVTGTACQAGRPDSQGSATKTGSTMNTRNAQMPDLPKDPAAAEAAVRTMLMNEAIVLLKASGLKYRGAQFDVPTSYDDGDTQNGDLLIQFQPCSDNQVKAMTTAIWAHGWEQGGISHGVNVHKGPLYLQWGGGIDGCDFRMTTVNIGQYLPGIKDITSVPELVAFKAEP